MKKAMAKHGFQLLVAALVLFGSMAFSATEAHSQSTDITLLNQSQNFNWLSEAEAMVVLEAQMIALDNDLATLPQGSPAYKDALNHFVYYKLIYSALEDGTTSTMEATNSNLFNVQNENGLKDATATPINLNQLYQDAVGLLTV